MGGCARVLLDQVLRAVELVDRCGRIEAVEQQVTVGVRPERDQPGRRHVAHRRPRQGGAVVGEVDALVDVARGQVHRGGHLVADEDRRRHLGQVGGAVVERHDDRAVVGVVLGADLGVVAGCVASRRVGPVRACHQQVDRVVERHHPPRRGEPRHLLVERLGRQVDLGARPAADPVVDQHHDARNGRAHAVAGRGQRLHRAQSHRSCVRHRPSLRSDVARRPHPQGWRRHWTAVH